VVDLKNRQPRVIARVHEAAISFVPGGIPLDRTPSREPP
jgi:hypothetical protein